MLIIHLSFSSAFSRRSDRSFSDVCPTDPGQLTKLLTDHIDDLGVIAEVIASGSFVAKFQATDNQTYVSVDQCPWTCNDRLMSVIPYSSVAWWSQCSRPARSSEQPSQALAAITLVAESPSSWDQ
jgi:hypothetical protein